MEKIILTDIDGVCLDWEKSFFEYMANMGFTPVPGTDDEYRQAIKYGLTEKEIRKILRMFNTSTEIKHLSPYKDAQEYIPKLHEEGFRFVAISSISEHPNTQAYRCENLLDVFGDVFKTCDVTCLPTGSEKHRILEQNWLGTGYFWIEDYFGNAEAGYEVGLRPILVDSVYTRHYSTDLFPRTSLDHPWKDIYDIITEFYNSL